MQPHYVDCEGGIPRWAEVADKENAARVREVMLNTQEFNEQLGQHHLVNGAALHDGLGEQVTGQLHLTKHAYLRIGGLTRQQDIELIDQLSHGDVVEHGHADDGPDPQFHGYMATAQVGNALLTEPVDNERRGNEVGEWLKLGSIAGMKEVERLLDTHKKIRNQSIGFGFLHIRRSGQ